MINKSNEERPKFLQLATINKITRISPSSSTIIKVKKLKRWYVKRTKESNTNIFANQK